MNTRARVSQKLDVAYLKWLDKVAGVPRGKKECCFKVIEHILIFVIRIIRYEY